MADITPESLGTALRAVPCAHFINGDFLGPSPSESVRKLDIINSATERPIAESLCAGRADVDLAVAAARKSFDDGVWSKRLGSDRAVVMKRIAEGIKAR
ncbi:conserved hypothetical protein [Perkinsus marinus ATCC 50983]|uniref:Aldehyde dehydrogenase domain-containing protein n=1 Tax=Perkinsus marinus (strain ATCC 50983 / TXsc) TaxID=423536 RepID=C5KI19_PERM5|nr:conserved hypothetical protein [Perkinsus marinus ATCC 50983]EER16231.1 conserved hypothetical protein [Perkinsus marinus ATCC 50983]|eukprot:XP_002784435.1 conserved hypothetical protein [Perkinsus marinus ATCC 50983]